MFPRSEARHDLRRKGRRRQASSVVKRRWSNTVPCVSHILRHGEILAAYHNSFHLRSSRPASDELCDQLPQLETPQVLRPSSSNPERLSNHTRIAPGSVVTCRYNGDRYAISSPYTIPACRQRESPADSLFIWRMNIRLVANVECYSHRPCCAGQAFLRCASRTTPHPVPPSKLVNCTYRNGRLPCLNWLRQSSINPPNRSA